MSTLTWPSGGGGLAASPESGSFRRGGGEGGEEPRMVYMLRSRPEWTSPTPLGLMYPKTSTNLGMYIAQALKTGFLSERERNSAKNGGQKS